MKNIFFLLAFLPLTAWAYQQPAAKDNGKKSGTITLACRLISVPSNVDTLRLYEYIGLAKRVVARGVIRPADSAYVFTLPMSKPRFYGVGFYENNTAKVLLGEEAQVTLWANVQFLEKARTSGSPANKKLEQVQKDVAAFQVMSDQARELISLAYSSGGNRAAANEKVDQVTKAKAHYLDSLKTADPLLWRMATLYLTPEFKPDGRNMAMAGEVAFVGQHFFDNANLSDKAYEEIPDLFNAWDAYAKALLNASATEAQFKEQVDPQLNKLVPKSRMHRIALGGVVAGLKALNSKLFPVYATMYLDLYRNDSYGEIGPLEFDVRKSSTFMSGFEAPDLSGMTPDSSKYSLRQMRGKIVLVDFWASWCGPCRREMPNVVAAYNKYKDKGFDILGVSLDRDMPAWKNAIKQDGLPWHHISDLKGWQSEHAALYSINSIPATVLVDKDGKIIARNLRGEELGAKLKEIFGQ